MAVAPEIKEIGMVQLNSVSAVLEAPNAEARDELLKRLIDDIRPKVYSIFKHYDTAPPHGFWGPEEAAVFFGHYAEHYPHIEVTLVTKEIEGKAFLKMMLSAIEADLKAGTPEAEEVRKQIDEKQEMFDEEKKTTRDRMTKQLLSYQENKKERNEEAFKFLDANGDQKIELSELMAAMQVDNKKNTELIGALGLSDGKEPLTKRGRGRCVVM